ncbi:Uncharacterized protein APZ42_012540 [Daphnia magna]|uniref:ERAP1-like C-terminal domain-containing protein n=1 Tax=Daphnia magna TaxID=35525 RepID=A0A162RQ53_9CRUS|nr:Uncharacterized protein APZ42_012540 [Daphnia magna]
MTNGADPKFSLDDRIPVVWLTPKVPSVAIKGPDDTNVWILVNLQYSGYYRVNYDRLGWELLSEQLIRNHTVIPPLNRAQLIDDVFTLCHVKTLPYEVSVRLVEYLGRAEEENFVRSVAVGHVGRIKQMMALQGIHDEKLDAMVKVMMTYIVPTQNTESRNHYNSGQLDVHCHNDDKLCVDRILDLFRGYINDTVTPAQSSLTKKHFEDIWCTALRYGGPLEWSYAWNSSRDSSATLSKKRKIFKAMACTTDTSRIKQLLSRVFLPKINQEPIETSIILNSLAENPSARLLAMKFVMLNWAFLNKHFRNPPRMRDLLVAVTRRSSSLNELEKVNEFLEDKANELGPAVIDLIVATISSNVRHIELQKIHLKYHTLIGETGNDLTRLEENVASVL